MMLVFADQAWDDFKYWQKTNRAIMKRIIMLLDEVKRQPFEGTGKPEPLKNNLAGYWSRRITNEHRLVYKVLNDRILIAQMRYHY